MAIIVLMHDNLTIKKVPLDENVLQIGRAVDSDIFIDDSLVSKSHAKIETVINPNDHEKKAYYIEDLDSTNHTYVNGQQVTRQLLSNNDTIRIGLHSFKFIDRITPEQEKTLKLRKSWIPGVYYTKD